MHYNRKLFKKEIQFLKDNNLQSPPKCKHENCKNISKFISYPKGYQLFCCKKCSDTSKYKKDKISKTMLNNPELLQRQKEKRIQTWLKKYGIENISKVQKIKDKKKETFKNNPNIIINANKKRVQTCLQKYGVTNISKHKNIKKRIKDTYNKTMMKKYKTIIPMNVINIKNKWYKTMVKNGHRKNDPKSIYYYKVYRITRKQQLNFLYNHEKLKNNNSNKYENFSLDHKISLDYGYKNNISPEIIGDITNLQIIPFKQNCGKRNKNYSIIEFNNYSNEKKLILKRRLDELFKS